MIDVHYETKAGFLIEWVHVDTLDRGYGYWVGNTVGKNTVKGGVTGGVAP